MLRHGQDGYIKMPAWEPLGHSQIPPATVQSHHNCQLDGRNYNILLACTTGFRFFVECLRHSAKTKLHLAKPLPSAALDKAFAECGTRQRTHGKKLIGKTLFAESPGGTWQRKATVTAPAPLTVALPSANPADTRQRFFIFF